MAVDAAYLLIKYGRTIINVGGPYSGAHDLYSTGTVFVLKPWPAAVTRMANDVVGSDLRELNYVPPIFYHGLVDCGNCETCDLACECAVLGDQVTMLREGASVLDILNLSGVTAAPNVMLVTHAKAVLLDGL